MYRLIFVLFVIGILGMPSAASAIDPTPPQTSVNDDAPRAEQLSSERPSTSPRSPAARRTSPIPGPWLLEFNSSAAWFADQTEVIRSGDSVRMWVTMVYPEPVSGTSYAIILHEFDCVGRRSRELAGSYYSQSGRVTENVRMLAMEYIIPGSAFETVLDHACSDFSNWGEAYASVQVPGHLRVQEAASNLFQSFQNENRAEQRK